MEQRLKKEEEEEGREALRLLDNCIRKSFAPQVSAHHVCVDEQPSPWLPSTPPLKRTRNCRLYIPSQMNKDGRVPPRPSLLQTKGATPASPRLSALTAIVSTFHQRLCCFLLKGKMKVVLKGS